jgi:hypothetical protein
MNAPKGQEICRAVDEVRSYSVLKMTAFQISMDSLVLGLFDNVWALGQVGTMRGALEYRS